MCQSGIQRQKCVVLSLCLIIVKDKWRIERKILYYSTRLTLLVHYASAPTHPSIHSNKKHISQKSPSTVLHIFSLLFLHPFFTAKNENHLSPSSILRSPSILNSSSSHVTHHHPFFLKQFIIARWLVGTFYKYNQAIREFIVICVVSPCIHIFLPFLRRYVQHQPADEQHPKEV
jgi:hypothetical protein